MIKTVVLGNKVYTQLIPREVWYTERTRFMKYIAENGNAICTVNGEIVERDAGNDIYRKLKAEGAVVETRETYEKSDDEIIRYIESGIDKYVEYIDNYRQYEDACRSNERLRKLASEFKRIAK